MGWGGAGGRRAGVNVSACGASMRACVRAYACVRASVLCMCTRARASKRALVGGWVVGGGGVEREFGG